ncbi:MAG TPA: protein kinase [Gemmatimonadales bacterium]|nr:protein kinase [Gemmatimonadales bacterium]
MTTDLFHQLQSALGAVYRLERELGGGMSHVFLAEEKRLGRRVVVKALSAEQAASISAERFEREIRFAAQLQDPRIVPLLTAGHAAGISYYTMPYVEGESLRARLARGPVPFDEAIGILRDVALALDYAHARHVVHRDIKPENILLTGRTAVVTDFGIAKAISAATEGGSRDALTTAGSVVGTPAYMAPEQAAGDVVDHRADMYAWGVVAFEVLTGNHPFGSRPTAQSLMAAHIAERPARLADRAPGLPASLRDLVDQTLEKDPTRRPESVTRILRVVDGLITAGTSGAQAIRIRRSSWVRAILAAAVLAVVVMAGALFLRRGSASDGARGPSIPRSLAVLPFASPDRDSANAYFGAGMAEELTTALANVPGLRVASRGSASHFQAVGTTDAEIARELGVQSLLEGTVRRSGNRIRVAARLMDPKDGTVLWAGQYDRRLAEVFDVQDDMARAIVTALRPTLGDTAQLGAARAVRGTADLTAYDLYLKGRYYWGRRGETGLRTAIALFERAIARDSGFARAWAGLSMAQVVLPFFSPLSADSLAALASRNAQRALRLDSTLADAHLAWAYALKCQWRWAESERQFQDALALAPDDAPTHHWYGILLSVLGRVDEAVEQVSRARQLDPLSTAIGTDLGYELYLARRHDEGLRESKRVAVLDPTKSDNTLQIGMIQLARGRPDSAVAAFEAAQRQGSGFDMPAFLSVAYRLTGSAARADSLYGTVRARYRTDPSLSYAVAVAAAGAGDLDRGIAAVKDAIDHRSVYLTEMSLPCDPMFDPLKRDQRFGRMLAQVGMKACHP